MCPVERNAVGCVGYGSQVGWETGLKEMQVYARYTRCPAYAQGCTWPGLASNEGWRVSCYVSSSSLFGSVKVIKFNPYAALLTTGVLMLATVVFAQTRSSVELLKAGVGAVDRDVSSFAEGLISSKSPSVADQDRRLSGIRMASTDPRERVSEE